MPASPYAWLTPSPRLKALSVDANLQYWLRLALVPGVGPETQRHLLAAFGQPENIFSAGRFAIGEVVGKRLADQLLDHDNAKLVDQAMDWAIQPGNAVICLGDPNYPAALLQTSDPPCLLYAKGRVDLLQAPAVALVGARNATPQGASNAEAFAAVLSRAGLTVVSGLALGVDAAAHQGALKGSGSTIAVIGTGADRVYPARNQALARAIAEEGLILSEFALGTPAAAYNFPRRNRIISGLSRGVLVVEAAVGSGSLITARLAAEQGREVFAIPGSIHSPLSKGCHQLIKQGAKLVESAEDVLEELGVFASPPGPSLAPNAPTASAEAGKLLEIMGFDPIDSESLSARSCLTPDALFAILTELELDGLISRLPGGRFQRLN